jgi:phosphatidylethanolamine-binding protein (PEBP) family uncharacterized protein
MTASLSRWSRQRLKPGAAECSTETEAKTHHMQAMKGHVLANAELIGTYQKGDR